MSLTVIKPKFLEEPFKELDLTVVDNVLTEECRRDINNFLHRPGWNFGWKSIAEKDQFSFWHKHFAGNRYPDNYDKDGLGKQYECTQELREKFQAIHLLWQELHQNLLQRHLLLRCYANGYPFGSEGSVHTDSISSRSYTSIYYPHETWHPNWGGETVFFNEDKTDIVASVYPKPNRLILFNGRIPHCARGVSRSCLVLRVTLMFKTELDNDT